MDADVHPADLLGNCRRAARNKIIEDILQLFADKHGNNGRRSLVGAEPVIVARGGGGKPQQVCVLVDRLHYCRQEKQKPEIILRSFTRIEQILSRICHHGPVVMLARAVHACKWLLVKQAGKSVAVGNLFHAFHYQLIVIGRNIGRHVDRRKLMLRRGSLIVLGLPKHAQLPKLYVQLLHKGGDPFLDSTEIVVVKLLPLRRHRAEQRSPGENQILSLKIFRLVDNKILLLRTHRTRNTGNIRISEKLHHTDCLLADCLHGTQKRRFLIQCLPGIGAEGRRNAERNAGGIFLQERR